MAVDAAAAFLAVASLFVAAVVVLFVGAVSSLASGLLTAGFSLGCIEVALYRTDMPQPISTSRTTAAIPTIIMRPVFGGNRFTFANTPWETFDIVSLNFSAAEGLGGSLSAYACSNSSPYDLRGLCSEVDVGAAGSGSAGGAGGSGAGSSCSDSAAMTVVGSIAGSGSVVDSWMAAGCTSGGGSVTVVLPVLLVDLAEENRSTVTLGGMLSSFISFCGSAVGGTEGGATCTECDGGTGCETGGVTGCGVTGLGAGGAGGGGGADGIGALPGEFFLLL